ncbi:hypothetical protein PPL_12645 [Heterostelium album PN500]|uniref:Uncharacterized protein n=1 Tax=Heterostelium pallidum (strain ATCC 26659 / Pp 5 / PN500) TaxID=670386 RepID=D3BN67_HETP5|nr:hypothetical protein PPL_12645 [Heterostelium album PN500]EFA77429.1 hypothetical protein PPL_12645 [Heterostelium album PN500]|eukprot:XP_020429558.1 hypothetical protein PPL_12645 [Heterostelium album PN500]
MNFNNKTLFYIDSADRTNGSSSNFQYHLEDLGFISTMNYDRVVITQATIPKSFYTIRKNLNSFTLKERNKEVLISIPIGGILKSLNVINLQGDNVLYIHSDICTNGNDDILQEIYASSGIPDYSYIYWKNTDVQSYCGNTTTFILSPNTAFNLSRSWLQFTLTIPAGGNNLSPYLFADFISFFQQITFGNGTQAFCSDIKQAHIQSKMTMKINRKLSKTLSRYCDLQVNAAGDKITFTPCFSSNKPADQNIRYDNSHGDRSYTEPAYLIAADTNNQPTTVNVKIYFADIFDSIFALDKDLCFSENMYVVFTWNPLSCIGFYAGDDPTENPAQLNQSNITKLEIHLANETNKNITNDLLEQLASPQGLQMIIPYTQPYNKLTNGSSQSCQSRYNASNGITLDRIYYSIFTPNNAANPNLSVYNNNLATNFIDYFSTSLNNEPLTIYNVYPNRYDDFDMNSKLLEGTTIQTPNINNYNWTWVQDFGQGVSSEILDNIYKGIPLTGNDVQFDFTCNLVAGHADNLQHQIVAVTKRRLFITDGSGGKPRLAII